MSTPTPRTDAAWASSFEPCEYRAAHTARTMRDECERLEIELATLTAERDQLRAEIELDEQLQAATEASLKTLTAERDQLRAIFPRICAALGNGAFCTPTVSVGFIESIPNEVQLVVDQLRSDCENETKWAAHYLAQAIADKARAERLALALKDAISTYDPSRKETLVSAERQEAWIAALREDAK